MEGSVGQTCSRAAPSPGHPALDPIATARRQRGRPHVEFGAASSRPGGGRSHGRDRGSQRSRAGRSRVCSAAFAVPLRRGQHSRLPGCTSGFGDGPTTSKSAAAHQPLCLLPSIAAGEAYSSFPDGGRGLVALFREGAGNEYRRVLLVFFRADSAAQRFYNLSSEQRVRLRNVVLEWNDPSDRANAFGKLVLGCLSDPAPARRGEGAAPFCPDGRSHDIHRAVGRAHPRAIDRLRRPRIRNRECRMLRSRIRDDLPDSLCERHAHPSNR